MVVPHGSPSQAAAMASRADGQAAERPRMHRSASRRGNPCSAPVPRCDCCCAADRAVRVGQPPSQPRRRYRTPGREIQDCHPHRRILMIKDAGIGRPGQRTIRRRTVRTPGSCRTGRSGRRRTSHGRICPTGSDSGGIVRPGEPCGITRRKGCRPPVQRRRVTTASA